MKIVKRTGSNNFEQGGKKDLRQVVYVQMVSLLSKEII